MTNVWGAIFGWWSFWMETGGNKWERGVFWFSSAIFHMEFGGKLKFREKMAHLPFA